jgi:hypothetical protein
MPAHAHPPAQTPPTSPPPNSTTQASLPVKAPGALQLVAGDISQRQTLTPGAFQGVAQVVSCTAVKVQPKEGDTVDRQKYYQVR